MVRKKRYFKAENDPFYTLAVFFRLKKGSFLSEKREVQTSAAADILTLGAEK